MLFNSYEFVFLFLPVVVAGFFLVARWSNRLAATWLCVASLFFYGWWNPKFVALLIASIAFNYAAGWLIDAAHKRGRALVTASLAAAVTVDLAVLVYFKYANFFIATIDAVSGANCALVNVVLPLGISFFTFTQIAFLVDVHRGIATRIQLHPLLPVRHLSSRI